MLSAYISKVDKKHTKYLLKGGKIGGKRGNTGLKHQEF